MDTTVHQGGDMHMKRQAGFTLVELAVVVFLIGLLATMGISALKAQLASAAISATRKKQETIKDALAAYLARSRRLPCPAVDATGGLDIAVRLASAPPNCITNFGIVPYAELGLPRSAALDGWDNFFSYAVSPRWTATLSTVVSTNTTNDPTFAFNIGNIGSITVNDRSPPTLNPPNPIANPAGTPPSGAVAVLISHGVNGAGAYTVKGTRNASSTVICAVADEVCNYPPANLSATPPGAAPTSGFFQREYTEADVGYGAFDDIVMWISPGDILNPLIKDGAMQSAMGQFADQVNNIKNYLLGQAPSTCKLPQTLPTQFATDPWGNQVVYSTTPGSFNYTPYPSTLSLAGISSSSAVAATTAYTISDTSANQVITGPSLGAMFTNPNLQAQCP